ANRSYVDYFPSYELINSPPFRGAFFEPNQRSVNPHGVNFVMDSFFKSLEAKFGKIMKQAEKNDKVSLKTNQQDVVCEEELLAAFGEK
ncbi:MAG: GSCFA domain-containing protein, partial [Methylovulum sp.]|nr:GSCFA domain-containing protein [Methylovulum sp.]